MTVEEAEQIISNLKQCDSDFAQTEMNKMKSSIEDMKREHFLEQCILQNEKAKKYFPFVQTFY